MILLTSETFFITAYAFAFRIIVLYQWSVSQCAWADIFLVLMLVSLSIGIANLSRARERFLFIIFSSRWRCLSLIFIGMFDAEKQTRQKKQCQLLSTHILLYLVFIFFFAFFRLMALDSTRTRPNTQSMYTSANKVNSSLMHFFTSLVYIIK